MKKEGKNVKEKEMKLIENSGCDDELTYVKRENVQYEWPNQ